MNKEKNQKIKSEERLKELYYKFIICELTKNEYIHKKIINRKIRKHFKKMQKILEKEMRWECQRLFFIIAKDNENNIYKELKRIITKKQRA